MSGGRANFCYVRDLVKVSVSYRNSKFNIGVCFTGMFSCHQSLVIIAMSRTSAIYSMMRRLVMLLPIG